jgi:hypothetical protein
VFIPFKIILNFGSFDKVMLKPFQFLLPLLCLQLCCKVDAPPVQTETVKTIVIVMDGARYSETFGDLQRTNIPGLSNMAASGILFENFFTCGPTYTNAGHLSITTGSDESINNSGMEYPLFPSYFQLWSEKSGKKRKCYIVASKDKLEILANTRQAQWKDRFVPETVCGVSGNGSGYCHDSVTFQRSLHILANEKPYHMLINFREPDYSGHNNNWQEYLEGIRLIDTYITAIWEFIKTDAYYAGKTNIFITNDHGRHDDNNGGFSSHGDACHGCRKIMLVGWGANILPGRVVQTTYSLCDLHASLSKLMGLENTYGKGTVISEIFNRE